MPCGVETIITLEDLPEDIVGYNIVKDRGGDVVIIPLVEGFSTTKIIDRILKNQNG